MHSHALPRSIFREYFAKKKTWPCSKLRYKISSRSFLNEKNNHEVLLGLNIAPTSSNFQWLIITKRSNLLDMCVYIYIYTCFIHTNFKSHPKICQIVCYCQSIILIHTNFKSHPKKIIIRCQFVCYCPVYPQYITININRKVSHYIPIHIPIYSIKS